MQNTFHEGFNERFFDVGFSLLFLICISLPLFLLAWCLISHILNGVEIFSFTSAKKESGLYRHNAEMQKRKEQLVILNCYIWSGLCRKENAKHIAQFAITSLQWLQNVFSNLAVSQEYWWLFSLLWIDWVNLCSEIMF